MPYASSSEHVELLYARVRHADGTVAETQTSDAMDMPSAVTRAAPFYSDQKELQLPIRSLHVGTPWSSNTASSAPKPKLPASSGARSLLRTAVVLRRRCASRRAPTSTSGPHLQNPRNPTRPPPPARPPSTSTIGRSLSSTLPPARTPKPRPQPGKRSPGPPSRSSTWSRASFPPSPGPPSNPGQDIGAWYRSLEADRIVPDDTVKAKAAELTAGKSTDQAKAEALYSYVATNIHYIGVAFGIGRYQPHTAAEILSNQYGDCKDKHTLLAAMLSAVGIQSDAVLIGAGIRFNEAVPSPVAFNHLITHLTLDGKPVWLDTTAEVAPFGMLTIATRDKQALVIPNTAVATILRTPVDPLVPDSSTMDATGSLDANGVSTSHIVLAFHGDGEIAARSLFRQISPAQLDQTVQVFSSTIGFTGTVTNPDTSRPTDTSQPFKLAYDYKREKAGDWDHLKTIPQVMPVVLPRVTDIDPPVHAIQLGIPRIDDSKSAMKLPDGWTAVLPAEVHVKCAYAAYDMTYRFDNGTVYAERRVEILAKKVPVSDWQAYKAWVDKVNPGHEPYIQLVTATAAAAAKSSEQRTPQIEDAPQKSRSHPQEQRRLLPGRPEKPPQRRANPCRTGGRASGEDSLEARLHGR